MRILLGHNHYRQHGGEEVVFAAEKALLSRYENELVLYEEENRRIAGVDAALAVNTIWSRPTRVKLLRLLRDSRPEIAHFHNTFPLISPSAYDACREMGVPVVQTLHNYRLICPVATLFRDGRPCNECVGKSLPWPSVLHACYHDSRSQTAVIATMLTIHNWFGTWQNQVDIYIAPTEFARRKLIEGGLPPGKIIVKSNFVYPDPGTGDARQGYALFVGRLSSEKGVKTALKAWRRLKKIPLKIAGGGPLMAEVRAVVERDKLEHVHVLGPLAHDDVFALLKGASCAIFPSEWFETFGRVVIEAFACGVPVITSRLGAMAEIVEDGRTGLLFTPGDAEDLAAKVDWIWSHPKHMARMGREARHEYESKYTAERNYQRLSEIYKMAVTRSE